MRLEPSQHGPDLHLIFARLLLPEIENLGAGERGKARVQGRRISGANEQQRRIVRLVAQRIFDGEPRLADPAKAVDRPAHDRCARAALQRRAQSVERGVAADEQGPKRSERNVARLTHRNGRGLDQRIDNRGGEDLRDKVVPVGEPDLRIPPDLTQAIQMLSLRDLGLRQRWRRRILAGARRGLRDHQVLAEIKREPGLPLGVGNRRARVDRGPERGKPGLEVGSARQQLADDIGVWR